MKIVKALLVLIFAINLISCKGPVQETEIKNLEATSHFSSIEKFKNSKLLGQIVNDYDAVFNVSQKQELSDIIYDYNQKTTRQIVVVTVDKLYPYTDIQKFATDIGDFWGVGSKKGNNGLTIVFCKPERKVGIATGIGTEQILTNSICKKAIDSVMIPEFVSGNYYSGIKKGVIELISKWE